MFLDTVLADISEKFDTVVHTFNEPTELFYPHITANSQLNLTTAG